MMLSAMWLAAASLGAERVSAAPGTLFGDFSKVDGKKKKAVPKKGGKSKVGELKKEIGLAPKGLRWGMSGDELVRVYYAHFDEQFRSRYRKAEPGTETAALDAELRDLKQSLKRSRVKFDKTPTGIDYTALKGEYSYLNGESMMRATLQNGLVRNFFFFDDRLWKVYDEYQLKREKQLGPSYANALAHLTKTFGVKPASRDPDPKQHRLYSEHTWFDKATFIRAVDRGEQLGLVYADRNVEENLENYRKNQSTDMHAIDTDVASVTEKEPPPEAAEPDKKKKKKR